MKDHKIIDKLENLKKIREAKNITQVKLSVDLGISQELISRYELGYSFPQPNMLIRLADYFNCSVDYILGRTNITTSVKTLTLDKNNVEYSQIIQNYNTLSNKGKEQLLSYMGYLLTKEKE